MSHMNLSSDKRLPKKTEKLIEIYRELSQALGGLNFGPPVTHVYNPLEYARDPAEQYLKLASAGRNKVILLGMNPGPWGMAQTGVPFGTVNMVRGWLEIEGVVGNPPVEHPKRQILGFDVKREEVSGSRFWGWARERYVCSARFFNQFFVANYCPLVFMESSGKNRTPDKLNPIEKQELFHLCDEALRRVIDVLGTEMLVGIGRFSEDRARVALSGLKIQFGRILHPSPASPMANRGWSQQAEDQLEKLGIKLP